MRKLKGLRAPLQLLLPTSEYTEATLWESARPIPALPFLAAHPFAPLQSARALYWRAISNLTYPSASCDFAAVSVSEGAGVRDATPYGENAVAGGSSGRTGQTGPSLY